MKNGLCKTLTAIGIVAAPLLAAAPGGASAVNYSAESVLIAQVAQAPTEPQFPASDLNGTPASDPFAKFTPTTDPIFHRIDFDFWDFALKNFVISMGPSTRQTVRPATQPLGTRVRQGHNSRYRLEGAMLGFSFLNADAIAGFTEYRLDLQSIGDTLDISSLPRNEQLAFWLNLHNVAMVEHIALDWPVRQPREIELDGVPLDEAKFITVSGVTMSMRDIRERIVFANWRSPKVIYGFWRGEIGSPALERFAFTGDNVSSLLDFAADDFINSLRGTQKRGDRLDVSTLYSDTAAFYFTDFDNDVRAHIATYANEEVNEILGETSVVRASIREWDIADLSGGSRGSTLQSSRPGLTNGAAQLLGQRERKFENMRRNGSAATGRVFFSNIRLPGDPPNANAVE